MACVPCAIEMEPKTLSPGQINHVKAVAIQIKIEQENASDIFIQGLREGMEQISEEENEMGVNNSIIVEKKNKLGKAHNCLCNSLLIQSPDELRQKEPVTAPF
ncbi:uncharacterized protein [Spinacia oleracea]|uniref:Uncharacterized protein isoform X2 n=1 Tax=Spinacia oleracea TaxID=3562 RepID=A0ABM3RUF7_SPIOL|nr:uncharacterized protein LOC110801761 isoform X2 [Spinacia oleracea]